MHLSYIAYALSSSQPRARRNRARVTSLSCSPAAPACQHPGHRRRPPARHRGGGLLRVTLSARFCAHHRFGEDAGGLQPGSEGLELGAVLRVEEVEPVVEPAVGERVRPPPPGALPRRFFPPFAPPAPTPDPLPALIAPPPGPRRRPRRPPGAHGGPRLPADPPPGPGAAPPPPPPPRGRATWDLGAWRFRCLPGCSSSLSDDASCGCLGHICGPSAFVRRASRAAAAL